MFVARDIKQKLRLIFFWTPCTLQPGVAGEETNKLTFYSIQQLYPQYGIFGVGSNSLDISVF